MPFVRDLSQQTTSSFQITSALGPRAQSLPQLFVLWAPLYDGVIQSISRVTSIHLLRSYHLRTVDCNRITWPAWKRTKLSQHLKSKQKMTWWNCPAPTGSLRKRRLLFRTVRTSALYNPMDHTHQTHQMACINSDTARCHNSCPSPKNKNITNT